MKTSVPFYIRFLMQFVPQREAREVAPSGESTVNYKQLWGWHLVLSRAPVHWLDRSIR